MTKLKYLAVIFIAALVVTACNPAPQSTDTTQNTTPTSQVNGVETDVAGTTADSSSYTLEQIAQHATADDCWFAIEGNVYDVSPYIAQGLHPGEEAILLGCGKDATDLYNKRPGDNQAHSSKARAMLAQFQIGTLAQ